MTHHAAPMTFFAFGLNHETAPVALREIFALDEAALRAIYRSVPLSDESEVMLLSTCNRTEVYLYGRRPDVAVVQAALAARAGRPWPAEQAFHREDEDAIRHLLQVTAGLRSMVLGDAQILAQVKDAYRLAAGEDHIGAVLHRLVHTAFRTAKRVITETGLTGGAASVPTAAVALARHHFEARSGDGLAGRRVLLVGAGQMGRLVLDALAAHTPVALSIANRSRARAEALASTYGAQVIPWEARYDAVREAELVIVASGADEPVLHAARMPDRGDTEPAALLVDIAVPRNVEPVIDALPGYTVVDLDRLNAGLVRTEVHRRAEVPAARRVCEEALVEYVTWFFHQQALQPVIHAIRETFESIRVQEIDRHHHRFSDVDRAELDRLTTSIIQKLLAVPVVRLKSVDPDSVDFARGIKLLHALFSRPACEDASATAPPEAGAARKTLPSDAPALCPFEPDLDDGRGPEERLREALRSPRREDSG